MFTEPILPRAIRIEIGNLHHSPCANHRVNHFHFGASK
jgi:hypothetical protein